ncbi:MAG: TIGR04283 family arsenosugar biosynthesis glycosyltransferase [Deltaproteobacteria bacterium]|nr:TIGR04283 family arsenosugar biosynthesis glycosyltransferase [Deltaproteobacteria bacterium]
MQLLLEREKIEGEELKALVQEPVHSSKGGFQSVAAGGRRMRKGFSAAERLVVFCRYPAPGRVKTRLVPELGPLGAAELHRRLTERVISLAGAVAAGRRADLEIAYAGGSRQAMERWVGRGPTLVPQSGRDLGARMEAVFLSAFREGARRVVLVGTDIPGLASVHLDRALDALSSANVVLGPSLDGGYWLIGLDRPAGVFRSVPWGTAEVRARTLALVSRLGLRVHELDPLRDVDTSDDLRDEGWVRSLRGPFVSVIIPAFQEEAHVASAVRSARDEEAEILVVDGGSTDATVRRAAGAGARVVSGPRGRALQQNRGREESAGRVLLFLHADSRLPEGYAGAVFRTLLESGTAAGAFRFRTDGSGPMMRMVEGMTNIRSRLFQLPYGDQGIFLRREVFEGVGGFPEVAIAEDLLLVRRLARWGRIRIADRAVVTSARRWRSLGVLRTTLINQVILAGCLWGDRRTSYPRSIDPNGRTELREDRGAQSPCAAR